MFLPPMFPIEKIEPFDDERYIFEPKIAGHRLLLSIENGIVRLYTRHGHDITTRYPELHRVPVNDYSGILLDGEVACLNPDTGLIDYDYVLDRFKLCKPMSIQEATHTRPAHYFAFDILRYQGKDVRALPLAERKRLLEAALAGNHYFTPAIAVEGSGIALFEALKGKGLEGIVAKRLNSSYVGQRDENWQKIDYYDHAVVQIVGYRKNQFGWLMQQRDRRVGLLENGVPSAHKNAFHGVCNRIKTGEDRDFVYVEPSIEARVRFRRRNAAGRLSDPEFVDFVVS